MKQRLGTIALEGFRAPAAATEQAATTATTTGHYVRGLCIVNGVALGCGSCQARS
jgi:hypothetical protein